MDSYVPPTLTQVIIKVTIKTEKTDDTLDDNIVIMIQMVSCALQ